MNSYYEDLGIKLTNDSNVILQAFNKMALKYHPTINNSLENYLVFCRVCEAYEVLSNKKLKSVYDVYGEDKMKEGFYNDDNNLIGGYYFKGNPEEIFENFFGTFDLDICLLNNNLNIETLLNKKDYKIDKKDILITVNCNLKEIYNCTTKEIEYEYNKIMEDGVTVTKCLKKKNVSLTHDIILNNKLVFKTEGNEYPSYENSDLIITIKILNYNNYYLKNNNLYYIYKLSLLESFKGDPIKILSLDNKEIHVNIKGVIDPNSIIKIQNYGFNNKDLNLEFKLILPDLDNNKINKIISILEDN